ncbi:response regulator transcription factor [Trichlorobacter lovleyi]|uniref:response regulator n=1 Tax=Trichlorobacter lovleyi TaxID=313985 RepID=UPI002240244C|nr:response regulator transcription factor [Trichlorobacter lovleyi]QOX79894.1 response regulator transcription factor [Trichlorobacter lovleyi]
MASDKGTCAGIMLIDDHPAVRQGVALVLEEEGYRICGEADSCAAVHSFLEKNRPALALLDITLGRESGLTLIPAIRQQGVATLVYSMHEDPDSIEHAFAAGALGYVAKRESTDLLLEAVAAVLAGRRYVSPCSAQSLAGRVLAGTETAHAAVLSEREQQVLQRLGNGEATSDIAAVFGISVRTVETYYSRIIEKLKLDGMKALRRYAVMFRP